MTRYNEVNVNQYSIAMPQLILGSSSPYRKALLNRLNLPFTTASPDIDETATANETPERLVERLSIAKAQRILLDHPQGIIIGSDQIAVNQGKILGKPGDFANAQQQLRDASGCTVSFLTGLAVITAQQQHYQLVTTEVRFRELNDREISAYLHADQPYNCAGSFKSEALGISLFEHIHSDDPTALEGLPLITLCHFLRKLEVI